MQTSAASLNSSLVTMSWLNSSSFRFGVNNPYRDVGILTSGGRTVSHPYTKEKGVYPVAVLGVVLFAQRIDRSSSAHLPLAALRRVLMTLIIDLLLDSAFPLVCGYLGVAVLSCMFHLAKKFRVGVLMNWELLSQIISERMPNLQMMLRHRNVITSLSRT